MSMRKHFAFVAAVLAALLLAAPAGAGAAPAPVPEVDPAITDGTAARELAAARARWKEAGPAAYRFRIVRTCFCLPPRTTVARVRGRRVIRVSHRRWWGPRNVPQTFRVIGQAIKSEAAALEVTYDRKRGFPRRIWIDHIAMAVDDEIGYRIPWLKPLPTRPPGRPAAAGRG